MEDGESLIYIIIVYFILIFLSRIISYALGTYWGETEAEAELTTFIIVFIIDAIAMYPMVKFGHDGGIGETFNLVFIKAFPFTLFYLLGVVMIYWTIEQMTNFINFIQL